MVRSSADKALLTIASVLGVGIEVKTIETNKEITLGEELPSGTYILYVGAEVGSEHIRIVKNE